MDKALRYNQEKLKIELVPLNILNTFYTLESRFTIVEDLNSAIENYQNGNDFATNGCSYIDLIGYHLIKLLKDYYQDATLTDLDQVDIFHDQTPILDVVAEVFTMGAKKYAPFNWAKGASWLETLGSLLRHYRKSLKGELLDSESGLPHFAHALVNAIFLKAFYSLAPWYDDRPKAWISLPKIVLDIDDVIADFIGGYKKKYNFQNDIRQWYFSYKTSDNLKDLAKDKDFWINLDVLHRPDFIPEAYVSSREIPVEWTMEFLEKNNLPCRPVYHVGYTESKVQKLKELDTTIFIDDKYSNVVDAIKNGITSFLMHNEHNTQFNVGNYRIYDLAVKNIFSI